MVESNIYITFVVYKKGNKMSKYYNIKGVGKVRVSDHEANTALNGSNDIYLYIVDACNTLLSIEAQIDRLYEKRDLDISLFSEILKDFKDGSYDKNYFKADKNEDNYVENDYKELTALMASINENTRTSLEGHSLKLKTSYTKEGRAEIKALSELTGVSQSKIKKHFNIR